MASTQAPLPANHGSVGVVQLMNRYFAIYNLEEKYYFLTKPGKTDRATAEVAAKQFADSHQLTYSDSIPTPRIMTVVKIGSEWHPTVIFSNGKSIITGLWKDTIKKSERETIFLTERLAVIQGYSFQLSLDHFGQFL